MEPLYDKSYMKEKATKIRRAATHLLEILDEPNAKWNRSYYVDDILVIEDALNELHIKTREIMKLCGETEDDYLLRHMGKIMKGK